MINVRDNELLMRCSCWSSSHIAWLIHEPTEERGNNLKGIDDDWYLSVTLDNFSFWKRVRLAFRYIFTPLSIQYGMTAELVLKNEDIKRLYGFISRRLDPRPEHPFA
jgi:hypothetical protein